MYPFNWIDFRWRLLPVLRRAFRDGPPYAALRRYCRKNFDELHQPDVGGAVTTGWEGIDRWDIQELSDVALTDFYDPLDGVEAPVPDELTGGSSATASDRGGRTLEDHVIRVDPTGKGSLFWAHDELKETRLDEAVGPISEARDMLAYCRRTQLGIYLRICDCPTSRDA
jgi:hypothetical protein